MSNSKKILVTGAAGFIGFHLARYLAERGDPVVGLDNINDYYDVRLKYARLDEMGIARSLIEEGVLAQSTRYSNYRFVKLDIKQGQPLQRLFTAEAFGTVCHLAAQAGVRYSMENPRAYVDSNLAGFVNVIDLCRTEKVNHFVYASSSSVYGLNSEMPFSVDSDTAHPVSLYGATKKSNELIAHTFSHLFSLPTTGLRFFTVYGPWGRPDMAAFVFAKAMLGGQPIEIFNNGEMERDFTYIDDIIKGLICVLDRPVFPKDGAPFRIYNVGHGSPVRLMEFVEALESSLGLKARKVLRPMQPGDVRATWADSSELTRDHGYAPNTPIQVGIDRFIKWYKEHYSPDGLV